MPITKSSCEDEDDDLKSNTSVVFSRPGSFHQNQQHLLTELVVHDALSTISWTISSCLIRQFYPTKKEGFSFFNMFLPQIMIKDMDYGLIFASTWLVLGIKDMFGPIPLIPTRISEWLLGRLSLFELAVLIPLHFVVTALSILALHYAANMLPISSANSLELLKPICYDDSNPWIVELIQEVFVNALFCVGILVLPEVFKLNNIPRFFLLFIMLPIYNFGVDAGGRGSTFAPEILYALNTCLADGVIFRTSATVGETSLRNSSHILGPLLGGLLGGKIMTNFFPDD